MTRQPSRVILWGAQWEDLSEEDQEGVRGLEETHSLEGTLKELHIMAVSPCGGPRSFYAMRAVREEK